MSIKYILHGGASSKRTPANEQFFKEIVYSVDSSSINILCVYFARPEHRWQESFYEDKMAFEEQSDVKSLYIKMAERTDFVEQVLWANVIFINGGFKGYLKEVLEEVPNLPSLFENKVVVGISAGANILSKYYYSQGAEDIREGIGLLPIKVYCHYSEEYLQNLRKLENYKEQLPVYEIREEAYIILES